VEDFPIVLLGSEFWGPLITVLRDTQLARGTINKADVDRFYVTDSPEDAVSYITEIATRKFNLRYDAQPKRSSWLLEHTPIGNGRRIRNAKTNAKG
jgi:predicted Rossmann-fold nucleotide-binding protein